MKANMYLKVFYACHTSNSAPILNTNHFIIKTIHIVKRYLNAEYLVRFELSSMFHWFVLILGLV